MNLIYDFDLDTPDELLEILARNLHQRRLEKGLTRDCPFQAKRRTHSHDCQIRTETYHISSSFRVNGQSIRLQQRY